MKKKYFFILLALMFSVCLSVRSQTFVHPGAPLSKSDLDVLKAHVKAGDYPWKLAYDIMAADGKAQLTYQMQGPFATVSRTPDLNRGQWMSFNVACKAAEFFRKAAVASLRSLSASARNLNHTDI